jgi:hypothetical protein
MEYSEHDGVNLQLAGNTAEIRYWYNLMQAIISALMPPAAYPAKRFLPFALLFFRTFLPPRVLIRVRKPWVFFLLLLCG